jgi:hypothetical protein
VPNEQRAVRGHGGDDGPFVESKGHLAGFWIIEAADVDVALALAADGSRACNRKSRCGRSGDPPMSSAG